MKIVHFSDTHLGFNDLDILNDENINQREVDFYNSFAQVVEQIQSIKPDYIIHTGDLFHRTSPSNRAITFALNQFKIINSLQIPCIMIAGNHSTPRTNLSSPILKIFENFENIHVVYEQHYKKIEFDCIIFHCIPHMNDESIAESQIDLCYNSINYDKKNIMMMHCSVGSHYLMKEFGEWVYPKDKEHIFEKMNYVALGHWHGFGKVGKHKNVYYAGSTERTSLNDKRNTKGFIVANLADQLMVDFHNIETRPIYSFEINCEDFESSVEQLDLTNIKDAIVDVNLFNLSPIKSIDISNADIKNIFVGAMYVHISRIFVITNSDEKISDVKSTSLENFFIEHIKEDESIDEKDFLRIEEKIMQLFHEYEEVESDTE